MVQEAARIATQSGGRVLIPRNFSYREMDRNAFDAHGVRTHGEAGS